MERVQLSRFSNTGLNLTFRYLQMILNLFTGLYILQNTIIFWGKGEKTKCRGKRRKLNLENWGKFKMKCWMRGVGILDCFK